MHYSTYVKIICLSNRGTCIFRGVHINAIVIAPDEIYPSINKFDLQLKLQCGSLLKKN